jgi:surface polysaccharide O-acyltransferase-like enzyme
VFFATLVLVSFAAYAPLVLVVGPLHWTGIGPFAFQTSRIVFYAVYFAVGIVVGALGMETALPERTGPLARRWWLWASAALVAFAATIPAALAGATHPGSRPILLVGAATFVLSCAASSFAALALFLRFATRARPALDGVRDQAYGVYLVHYPIVTWLQLAVLGLAVPGLVKAGAVWLAALALSVLLVWALRHLPPVRRTI